MKMKKIFAFLLAAQMLLVSMASCQKGETEETKAETNAPVSVETEFGETESDETKAPAADPYADRLNVSDELPEEKFSGNDFRFLVDEKYAYQLYSEDTSGVGLGLYIVKTIIMSHGEDISVSSKNGVTEFTFTLPLVN